MKLTKEWLVSKSACNDGVEWFENQKETDAIKILKTLLKNEKYNWCNWLVVRCMDKIQKVRYAVFAAELVIDIFEKKHPDDKRPRNAIDAARAYINNPCLKTKNAAHIAADAAADAAYVANPTYIDDAAHIAADAAANAANAYAAYTAAAAITNATYAATAAAKDKTWIKILKYGIKIIS